MKAFSIITIFTTRKASSVLVVQKSEGRCVIPSSGLCTLKICSMQVYQYSQVFHDLHRMYLWDLSG